MNIKYCYGNDASFKVWRLLFKKPTGILILHISKEISKSDFFAFFANSRGIKLFYEVVAEVIELHLTEIL